MAKAKTDDMKLLKIGAVIGAIFGGALVWVATPIHFRFVPIQSLGSAVIQMIAGLFMGAVFGGFIGTLIKIQLTPKHADPFDVEVETCKNGDCDQ